MDFCLGLVVGRRDVAEKAADVVVGERMFWRFFFFWRCFGRFSGILPEVSTEILQATC